MKKLKYMMLIVFILSCITLQVNLADNTYTAKADTLTESQMNTPIIISPNKYDCFTDKDTLYNEINQCDINEIKIQDYEANFLNVENEQNKIVNIVPLELLQHRGEYIFIGKEYGFFIKTQAFNGDNNYPNPGYPCNKSSVFVFDIDVNTELSGINYIHIKIEPLFCYDFLTSNAGSVRPYYHNYNSPNKEIKKNKSYFLSNVQFFSNILNQQHQNVNDSGYNANNDLGTIILSTIYGYSGQIKYFDAQKMLQNTIQVAAGLIPIYSEVLTIMQLLSDYNVAVYDSIQVQDNSGIGTLTCYGENKEEQIQNYNHLIKTANGKLPESIKSAILYGINDDGQDYVSFKMFTNYSTNPEDAWYQLLQAGISLKVVEAITNSSDITSFNNMGINSYNQNVYTDPITNDVNHVGSYNFDFRNAKYYDLVLDDTTNANNVHLLSNNKNYFKFTPEFTGQYALNLTNSTNINKTINDANGNNISESNGFYSLIAEMTYYIELTNMSSQPIHTQLVINTRTYNLHQSNTITKPNGNYLIRITGNNGCYTINSSLSAVKIMNFSNTLTFNTLNNNNTNNYDININNDYVYVLLSGNAGTTNLTSAVPQNASGTALTNTNNAYYKLYNLNKTAGKYYYIKIQATSSVLPNIVFYEANGNEIPATVIPNSHNKTLETTILLSTSPFYIGIKGSESSYSFSIVDLLTAGAFYIDGISANQYYKDSNNCVLIPLGINSAVNYNITYVLNNGYTYNDIYLRNSTSSMYISNAVLTLTSNCALGLSKSVELAFNSNISINIITSFSNYVNNYSLVIDENSDRTAKLSIVFSNVTFLTHVSYNYGSTNGTINISSGTTKYTILSSVDTITSGILLSVNIVNFTAQKGDTAKTYTNNTHFSLSAKNINIRYGGGTGTSSNPYLITNIRHYFNLSYSNTSSTFFKQTQNLNFSGIGSSSVPIINSFNATYDGNSKNIDNLNLSMTSSNTRYSVFATNIYGVVKYIKYNSLTLSNSTTRNMGAICANNYGEIRNITISGFNISNSSTISLMGGIAARNEGTIYLCIITNINMTANNSSNSSSSYLGGIAGSNYNGNIELSSISGTITSTARYIGGIAGTNNANGYIFTCASTSTINGYYYIGGITGINSGEIYNCIGAGTLNLNSNNNGNFAVGGMVGINASSGTVHAGYTSSYCIVNYTGPTINSQTFCPRMGRIVGENNASSSSVYGFSGVSTTINTGNLQNPYRYGFMWTQTFDQTMYAKGNNVGKQN